MIYLFALFLIVPCLVLPMMLFKDNSFKPLVFFWGGMVYTLGTQWFARRKKQRKSGVGKIGSND